MPSFLIPTSRKRRVPSKGIPSRTARRANSAHGSRAATLAYTKVLLDRLSLFEKEVERILFPSLQQFAEGTGTTSEPDRQDANLPRFVGVLLETLELYLAEYFDDAGLFADLEVIGKRVSTKNSNALARVIGISIRQADPGVGAMLGNFRATNVSRIKSLVGRELIEITQLLERSEATGARVEVLRKAIEDRFGVTRSKAALLARDQTLTLNADIARVRQQNVGIVEYDWTTSGDSRVRGNDPKDKTNHKRLDGTRHRWDTPPDVGDGRRLHPGEDYQCRCTASPVLPELA